MAEANEDEVAAAEQAETTVDEMLDGEEEINFTQQLREAAAAQAKMAASDLTRAVDAEVIADRLATLSAIVGVAGINDVEQGAELIAASEDVEAISAAVGLMTVDDLDRGLELGRMAGELEVLSRIVDDLEMPVLSALLGSRGERLTQIAADTILRAAASRSLTELIEATGRRIGDLGVEEIDEGVLRMAASDIAANRSAELSAAGLALGLRGAVEMNLAADGEELADSSEDAE